MDSSQENGEFHEEILEPNILIKEDPSEENILEPNVLIKEELDDNEDYLDYLNAGYPDISSVGTSQHLGLYETSTKRKFNDQFEDEASTSQKRVKTAYTLEFKLQVIEAAKKTNNREQARIHNIHESVIRRWRKGHIEARIKKAVLSPHKLTKSRLPGGGQKPQFPELENELHEWLRNQNLQSNNITKEEIKEKALSIYVGDKFVASDRWVSAFMKRYHRKENNSYIFHEDIDKSKDLEARKLSSQFDLHSKNPGIADKSNSKEFDSISQENSDKTDSNDLHLILPSDIKSEKPDSSIDYEKSLEINQSISSQNGFNNVSITSTMNGEFGYPLPLPENLKLDHIEIPGIPNLKTKIKRQAFTLEFKMFVIEAAKNSSNREQARIYNIHESVIRRWRKDHTEARIKEAMNSPEKMTKNRLPGGGQKPQFQQLEEELFQWVRMRRAQSFKVSRQIIKDKALSLYIGDNFAASDGWVTAFLKRYKARENDLTFVDTGDESNLSEGDIGGQILPSHYNIQSKHHSISDGHFINSHLNEARDEFADGDVPSPKLKRQAFTLEFKLQVMEAAKNSSNREQARLHNIHESVIRRWRKQISEEQIKEAVKDPNKMTLSRIPGAGRKRMFPELEKELKEWAQDLQSEDIIITKDLVKEKALSLPNGEKFVSSASFGRFMKQLLPCYLSKYENQDTRIISKDQIKSGDENFFLHIPEVSLVEGGDKEVQNYDYENQTYSTDGENNDTEMKVFDFDKSGKIFRCNLKNDHTEVQNYQNENQDYDHEFDNSVYIKEEPNDLS